jgi:hypothetical protein
MTGLDLRPLSLGEILDRTFTLYRRNFLLFMGIAGIPALLPLALNLVQLFSGNAAVYGQAPARNPLASIPLLLISMFVGLVAYLFSQGGTILAVTDLYLGRETGIGQSFGRMSGNLLSLLGVVLLNGVVIGLGMLALLIPGIYLACRLLVCVPAALIEDRGPRESLSRSFELTRDSAGRAFLILVLNAILAIAISSTFTFPFLLAVGLTAQQHNPGLTRMLTALMQVSATIGSVLVTPILLIATSVFYFDLRVRKEGFDLQFMLDPTSERVTRSQGSMPSILS